MLIVAGHVRVDPAHREAANAAANAVMAATRAEPGCISYTFSADLDDESLFHVFEEWQSQADLDAHFQTPHMASFQAALGGLGVRDMRIQKYEVASVGPLGG